ncbi:hypothetical protein GCM10009777_11390 [Microbacterium pumilum]|uniref:Polyketide cyclase n=1 Tax=Microbacterium pumilum TaxID=344165 RepID=A0ABN2S3A4_9MICO
MFAFFTDPSNDKRWRAHVVSIAAHEPVTVGSRVHQSVAGPSGRPIAADIVVTAFEPPTRYGFKVVAGPVRPVGDFRFIAVGDSATRVDFVLSAELTGLKKLLMGRAVQHSMDAEVAGLARAKGILESA